MADALCTPDKKYIGYCARCGRRGLKRNMTALYTKVGRDPVRVLCHLCRDCLPGTLEHLGVSMP